MLEILGCPGGDLGRRRVPLGVLLVMNRHDRRRWDARVAADRRRSELQRQLWQMEEPIREEQAAAGSRRMDAKAERTLTLGRRSSTAEVPEHASLQRRERDSGKGGNR
jgi:hypothetical protein